MSDGAMLVDTEEDARYVRTLEDVKEIVQHAKLDSKNLTEVVQALYYPTDADLVTDDLRLLELDDHLLEQIREGDTLHFKGGLHEKIVLCSESRTYDVKGAEISNSLLLVPDLKFGQATSTSPLKSPRTATERNLNDSIDDDDVELAHTLEHRQVRGIFHEYMECRQIRPRFRKIGDLLQLTRYSGPENEEFIDRRLLFSHEQLLDTVQCSRREFADGLRLYRAMAFEGHMRVLECDYEYRIVNLMVSLIAENSWPLDAVEYEETLDALDGIAPRQIVDGLFHIYTTPSAAAGKHTYREELVARIVARNILQPGLKFRLDEFMSTWHEALPEGMKCEEQHLRALGIFDKEGNISCVRSLAEERLPTDLHERLRALFKTKTKWTLSEMEPYIDCFTSPTLSVSQLLAKYARSLTEADVRYYVAKH